MLALKKPKLLNKHKDGTPKGSIYIGRGSPLGNFKVIGKDGTREFVITWYRGWLARKLIDRDPEVERVFRSLKDTSELVCFCVPAPCHGEVIIEYWEEIMAYDSYDAGLEAFRKKNQGEQYYIPLNDGVDHINIYSGGRTTLGRALTNFAKIGFDHPLYGRFASVEAFWYWLGTGKRHDHLRELYGWKAKHEGRKLEKIEVDDHLYQVREAIRLKIAQYPALQQALKESTLPFAHYYFYGDVTNPKVVPADKIPWLTDLYTQIRKELQHEEHSP